MVNLVLFSPHAYMTDTLYCTVQVLPVPLLFYPSSIVVGTIMQYPCWWEGGKERRPPSSSYNIWENIVDILVQYLISEKVL